MPECTQPSRVQTDHILAERPGLQRNALLHVEDVCRQRLHQQVPNQARHAGALHFTRAKRLPRYSLPQLVACVFRGPLRISVYC